MLNEVVTALNDEGFDAWLCPPALDASPATFLSRPAPTLPIEELDAHLTASDLVVFGWNSNLEMKLAETAQVGRKILWQHGILISRTPGTAGEDFYRNPNLFDDYWNVSAVCGRYIADKYGFEGFKLVHPFFQVGNSKSTLMKNWEKRQGVLFQALRGSRHIDRFARICQDYGHRVTVLEQPFSQEELTMALSEHRLFVSLDDGLRPKRSLGYRRARLLESIRKPSQLREALFPKPVWVQHSKNYVGFPMTPAQAARMGCGVISAPMGGGLEWMSESNCFLVRDGDLGHLEATMRRALDADDSEIKNKVQLAYQATEKFSRHNTLQQILRAVSLD